MYQYKHLVVFTQLGPSFQIYSDTYTYKHTYRKTHTHSAWVIACLFFF